MAEGKKGFILYADLIHTVNQLSDLKAGKLFKHILKYVNDESPISKDIIVNLAFTPIKIQLKRDLDKWESERKSKSDAGKKGMTNRWAKHNKTKQAITKDNSVNPVITKITDNVNVNDNVTVNVKERDINILNAFKENVFKESEELNIDKKITIAFLEHWTERDFESKCYAWQVPETFIIKSRLKGWVKNDNKSKKETKENNFKFPEAWKIKQLSVTEYQNFKKEAIANGWKIKPIPTTGQTSFEKDGKQIIL